MEPIAKIASLVGYDDQMYFSRVFRKRVGTSPSDFRKSSEAQPAVSEVPSAMGIIPEFHAVNIERIPTETP